MFCSQCGGKILDEAKFCSSCGSAVADASKAVTTNPILPPTNIDAKDLLKNHKTIGEEYANVSWVFAAGVIGSCTLKASFKCF